MTRKPIFSFTFAIIGNLASLGSCIQLDIHLKLRPCSCLYQIAHAANDELVQQSPTTESISFQNDTRLPHITLYLSDFQKNELSNIADTLTRLISKRDICQPRISNSDSPRRIDIDHVMIQGPYSMYHISKTYLLQHVSDTIVMNTNSFIIPNQTIPGWVHNLPEPERSKKVDYVHQYGSPNVLDEFDPHMTVGYDEYAPSDKRQKILEEILSRFALLEECSSEKSKSSAGEKKNLDKTGKDGPNIHWEIAVGIVGDWGTVLEDIWVMMLQECKDQDGPLQQLAAVQRG
mmetsp:Transcript_12765/g.23942  ORF Transcript_12765/g.23942 Transcript_12765/m.23942 type:complete len:289 (-) Transcript_12765:132-998(-)